MEVPMKTSRSTLGKSGIGLAVVLLAAFSLSGCILVPERGGYGGHEQHWNNDWHGGGWQGQGGGWDHR
jgi:hypothetical protein